MKKISIKNFSGYFNIESKFYRVNCTCDDCSMDMYEGLNIIAGDIDSGGAEFLILYQCLIMTNILYYFLTLKF